MIAASAEFIRQALRYRKMFGGGMRQAGILAAAGIYALEHNVERLAEDHQHAKLLAERISSARGLRLNPQEVETNIFFLQLDPTEASLDAPALQRALRERDVLVNAVDQSSMRLVTHLDVTRAQVEQAAHVICEVLNN